MHLMSFGYGETICPQCYDGEKQFIFLDKGYWLNRLLSRYIGQETLIQEQDDFDEILLEQMSHPPIIREAS
jgi:hypothetical protein